MAAAAATIAVPALARAAGPPPPAVLTPQDNADLQRVAAYLNGIRTMTAKFQQLANNGGVSGGRLWISRPGKMRFEYDPPTPIMLLADGFYVIYYDKELAESQKVGLKSTPAWFLLRDPVSFGDDLMVTRFERGQAALRITIVEKADPDVGTLTMMLSDRPLELKQWTILDQQGKRTTVSLSDMRLGLPIDPKTFVFQDPYGRGSDTNNGR